MKKKNSKASYTKYRTMYIPKEMVDALVLKLIYIESDIDKHQLLSIGLTVINDILTKSNFYRSNIDYPFHVIPMDSRYLQIKYGNDYHSYIHWMVVNCIIWNDFPSEGRATHYYLQSIETYKLMNQSIINDTGIYKEDTIPTYCLNKNIIISSETINNKGIEKNTKNRIFSEWYRIKISITKENKKYLIKDYEEDSIGINNAPKHVREMGRHYRKHLNIHYDSAFEHTFSRYEDEIVDADTPDKEISAFKRFSSRIASINAIKNGAKNKTLRFKRNNSNFRLDTNLTNMASDLRPFIVGYEDMAYLDLCNSQPVLFNILLKQYRKDASEALKTELQRYFEATVTGQWYECLEKIYNQNREECKSIWMEIAYSKNHHHKLTKDTFRKEFPFIYGIIENIKKVEHNQFAIHLQKIESKIFIDKICKALVNEDIIPHTMHDGLLVPKEHHQRTLQIMSDILEKEIGAVPKIKVE
jgi:hypothetical protein